MNNKKPLILVSNDDSVYSKGIKALVEIAKQFGNVVVVAPDKPQSAKSHAVTLESPIFVNTTSNFGPDVEAYKCSGTPADCVKMAIHEILKGRKPDLLLSGINHGSNASVNVVYSGTLAATIEGGFHDIPSIGLSLLSWEPDADFDPSRKYLSQIIEQTLKNGLPRGICLNVNIPAVPENELKGIKICKMTKGVWAEEFAKRTHPRGSDYFWLTGKYINLEPDKEDTDIWALDHNFIAIVPLHVDLTAYDQMEIMKNWNL